MAVKAQQALVPDVFDVPGQLIQAVFGHPPDGNATHDKCANALASMVNLILE